MVRGASSKGCSVPSEEVNLWEQKINEIDNKHDAQLERIKKLLELSQVDWVTTLLDLNREQNKNEVFQ